MEGLSTFYFSSKLNTVYNFQKVGHDKMLLERRAEILEMVCSSALLPPYTFLAANLSEP